MRDPYRTGVAAYERRPRRADELPAAVSFSALFPAVPDDADLDAASALTPPAILPTVSMQPQEGGILPVLDPLPTQS